MTAKYNASRSLVRMRIITHTFIHTFLGRCEVNCNVGNTEREMLFLFLFFFFYSFLVAFPDRIDISQKQRLPLVLPILTFLSYFVHFFPLFYIYFFSVFFFLYIDSFVSLAFFTNNSCQMTSDEWKIHFGEMPSNLTLSLLTLATFHFLYDLSVLSMTIEIPQLPLSIIFWPLFHFM